MTYFIGLDGGGTKTKCVIADSNLNLIAENTGSSSDFLLRGAEPVSRELSELILETIQKSGVGIEKIGFAVLGSTGAGREENASIIENSLRKKIREKISAELQLKVISDAEIALEGAHEGKEGAILICGTGSILFAKDENGEIFRAGGFGRILGDEGSGYNIGKEGLKLVAKHFDGIITTPYLIEKVKEVFDVNNSKDLIKKVYTDCIDIASFAPYVIKAAENGDKYCIDIIEKQIIDIIELINVLKVKSKMKRLKISFIGGLITNENYYSIKLRESINKFPEIILHKPVYPPEIGAVIKAKEYYNKLREGK